MILSILLIALFAMSLTFLNSTARCIVCHLAVIIQSRQPILLSNFIREIILLVLASELVYIIGKLLLNTIL